MSSFHYQKKKKGGKGFYIALGMCLIAIGVASWTTYDSVVQFTTPESSSSASPKTEAAQNTVSGIFTNYPEGSAKAESSKAPEVSSTPETSSKTESKSEKSSAPEKESSGNSSKAQETIQTPQNTASSASQNVAQTFSYPCGDTVTKNFSGEDLIYSETMQDWRVHSGVDLSAKNGDAVSAIGAGTVKAILQDDLLGNVIEIEHDGGIVSRYCGLGDTLLVQEGDRVSSGQKIGSVSTVPYELAERPHLHLEILKNGKAVDPISILENGEKADASAE